MVCKAEATAAYLVNMVKHQLVGQRIVAPYLNADGDFGFVVEDDSGQQMAVLVSCDAERNGVGWLSVESMRGEGVVGSSE